MMTVYNRMKEREILENEATNSEDEYYYKFPTKKRSTIGGAKKKHSRKRKAVAGKFYYDIKTIFITPCFYNELKSVNFL